MSGKEVNQDQFGNIFSDNIEIAFQRFWEAIITGTALAGAAGIVRLQYGEKVYQFQLRFETDEKYFITHDDVEVIHESN